ncbi:SIMPL domain-containing protein [Natrononativus amylolyticus]|uniref:SIMPL domain-containing protein n=1 Tax=Natrononativus amylolyticus TaxID=2963434 RepID=UPI0020CBD5F5|nr:SIMPL domain-containing protein [Natrononativus amylolyticus]
MDRRHVLIATGVGAATALAGCVGSAFTDGGTEEPIGGAPAEENGNTIEVSASGTAETDPDRAVATVGVEARGDTADEVRDELVEGAERLRETFADLEIPDDNVRTGRYNIRERRQGTGFEGSHSFSVEVDDVDRVGEVIDAAVDAGADDVGRVNFTLQPETREALRNEALDDALDGADAEAEHIAANRGVEITGTRSVSTSDVSVSPVRYDAAHDVAADDAETSTEIDSGQVSVTATVTVVYGFSS